jgi:hypothetical protein
VDRAKYLSNKVIQATSLKENNLQVLKLAQVHFITCFEDISAVYWMTKQSYATSTCTSLEMHILVYTEDRMCTQLTRMVVELKFNNCPENVTLDVRK